MSFRGFGPQSTKGPDMTDSLVRSGRRSFVRAAAWTVPVVSIAAAAPAYALTTTGVVGSVAGSAVSYNDTSSRRHVAWDLSLTNGAVAITSITIRLNYNAVSGNLNFGAFHVYGYTTPGALKDNGWQTILTGSGTVTFTHGPLPARATTFIHTDYRASNNSSALGSIAAAITLDYADGTSSTSNIGATWVEALDGHTHP